MGRYLEQFWTFWLGIFLRADWISRRVSPTERLSRFILDKRHIKGGLSPAAFLPPKIGGTSVYRTSGCTEWRVWVLGLLFVERKRKGKLKIIGRADLPSHTVLREGLRIRPLLRPHPRHAELTNWSEEKHVRKDKALALAEDSILHLLPKPNV
jgi:hypothetical protein